MNEPINWTIFNEVYRNRTWATGESVSGPGSTLDMTVTLRAQLATIFGKLGIRSIVDAPCGDMTWMRKMDYQFDKYIGVDVVPDLISVLNGEKFPENYHFQVGNITTDILPVADAILCRDCLVHLPFVAAVEVRRLWKLADFRFVFTTTFPGRPQNVDCAVGHWRPLNMELSPFGWPEPLLVLSEGHPAPFEDKSIGVWATW